MKRRALVGLLGAFGLAGCLASPDGTSPEPTPDPTPHRTKERDTRTPVRRAGDGVRATFTVVDSHAPVEETVDAMFDGRRVVVTGSMDPVNCRLPMLRSVSYDPRSATVRLVVGSERRYETVTVECGNASYDYRCVARVAEGTPTLVEVAHDHHGSEDRVFTVGG